MTRALFAAILGRRALLALAVVLAVAGALGVTGRRLRVDASIEQMFPVAGETRGIYDRYKARFPFDDARAVVIVEAPDLFTPGGLRRVQELEAALGKLPHATRVEGPLSVEDVGGGGDDAIRLERLFRRPDMPQDEIAASLARARADPSFRWTLVHPTEPIAAIQVRIEPAAARTDEGRRAFFVAAKALVERERGRWKELVLTGIPVVRARFIELVNEDSATVTPVAILVILLLLALTYRSGLVLVAALGTILASIFWTTAFMAALGIPLATLTSFSPVIVMIISISDTVHIVTDLEERMRAGAGRRAALVETMIDCAGPCLLTEIVIACGFLSLGWIEIVAITEFGVTTAGGMLLTWLANVTVLPLLLSLGSERVASTATGAAGPEGGRQSVFLRGFKRFVAFIERAVTLQPRRVVAVALAIVGAFALAATGLRKVHYVFHDLRPDSPLRRELDYAERATGGIVPLAVFLEPESGAESGTGEDDEAAPMLEPAALAFLARAKRRLEAFPEVKTALSPTTVIAKASERFGGEPGLPATRRRAAQVIEGLDHGKIFQDTLTFDRRAAAVLAHVPDLPSPRVAEIIADLEAWARAETPPGYTAHVTGVLAISDRVVTLLTGGLARSLATAVLVTLVAFAAVLRSPGLAVIGLIPNLLPLPVLTGLMALLGIDFAPSTALLFSMVLTIADDDTIQFLSRIRRSHAAALAAGAADPYREAVIGVLRETALPMFVTCTCISAGFLLLLLSRFQGSANLGLLTGATLFSAIFADLFVMPILLLRWRPKL